MEAVGYSATQVPDATSQKTVTLTVMYFVRNVLILSCRQFTFEYSVRSSAGQHCEVCVCVCEVCVEC
jgi:hypothetical protein